MWIYYKNHKILTVNMLLSQSIKVNSKRQFTPLWYVFDLNLKELQRIYDNLQKYSKDKYRSEEERVIVS